MRLSCPHCGPRDRREFTWGGVDAMIDRPDAGADPQVWSDYVHLRDNIAGPTRDLWYHDPCQTWLLVTRNTVTHTVTKSQVLPGAAQ